MVLRNQQRANVSPTPVTTQDRIVRPRDTAKMLSISISSAWRMAKAKRLNAVKISARATGFRLSEIQTVIAGDAQ